MAHARHARQLPMPLGPAASVTPGEHGRDGGRVGAPEGGREGGRLARGESGGELDGDVVAVGRHEVDERALGRLGCRESDQRCGAGREGLFGAGANEGWVHARGGQRGRRGERRRDRGENPSRTRQRVPTMVGQQRDRLERVEADEERRDVRVRGGGAQIPDDEAPPRQERVGAGVERGTGGGGRGRGGRGHSRVEVAREAGERRGDEHRVGGVRGALLLLGGDLAGGEADHEGEGTTGGDLAVEELDGADGRGDVSHHDEAGEARGDRLGGKDAALDDGADRGEVGLEGTVCWQGAGLKDALKIMI